MLAHVWYALSMQSEKKLMFVFFGILAVAALLRLTALGNGNALSDEVLYGFRSISYLDFDFALQQPSTLQLLPGAAPWWTKLSFHDHPPLVFAVQHVFFVLFGVSLWTLRLSSALFAIVSVWLVYAIGTSLFSKKTGLIAAAFMATDVLMVYVGRVGMQESQVIFFSLLAVLFFVKGFEGQKWLFGVGLALGAGVLSKYTALFIVPPLLIYAALYERTMLRSRYFYASVAVFCIVAIPVCIYNYFLYKTLGHFDFQLFHLFGQGVPYWQVAPGKELGSLAQRLTGIFTNFAHYRSPLSNVLLMAALGMSGYQLIKKGKHGDRRVVLLLLLLAGAITMYAVIGSAVRFLTLVMPFVALLVAWGVSIILHTQSQTRQQTIYALLGLLVFLEICYARNTFLLSQPLGMTPFTYSAIHWDVHDWGFNAVETYLNRALAGQYPALTLPYTYPFLEELHQQNIDRKKTGTAKPARVVVVYDDNIMDIPRLWTFDRRALYGGWPMISTTMYQEVVLGLTPDALSQLGGMEIIFITPANTRMPLVVKARQTELGSIAQAYLMQQGSVPEEIVNRAGEKEFLVYRFQQQLPGAFNE